MLLSRSQLQDRVEVGLGRSPIVALLGPRQCGKTTLAQLIQKQRNAAYFDLENPQDTMRLQNPQLTLSLLTGLVILDETQHRPDLMPVLRVLADRKPLSCRFLLLGSASPDLVRQSSETLAGRIEFIEMAGFTLAETGPEAQSSLWLRGGFPDSFLAATDADSWAWRDNFISTFLERDIPRLGIQIPPLTLRRFWMMVSHYHGQVWNASDIAASLGVAHTTTRRYLDLLSGAFVLRQLPPWLENVGKRTVKSPKIYIRDSGLLHSLLNLPSHHTLLGHPKLGASWEGFALEQVFAFVNSRHAYFWGTHAGAELDLLVMLEGKRYGFECKYADAPGTTKSMRIALADLGLEHLWVIYPGAERYVLDKRITVVPAREIPALAEELKTGARHASPHRREEA